MATDLAEFIGAALGLYLLFGIPLFPSALITGVAAFAILGLQARGVTILGSLTGLIAWRERLGQRRGNKGWPEGKLLVSGRAGPTIIVHVRHR